MSKIFVAAVICAQILVLVFMAGQREYIRATGEIVYFRTAPLDPRDPLRGDYVRLQYAINTLQPRQIAASQLDLSEDNLPEKDDVLYISLDTDDSGVASFDNISLRPPESKTYIKGRVNYSWHSADLNRLNLRYGIEQLFVQQGTGLAMEEKMGRWGDMQIPLEVEVALGGDGTAVTRGYRWSQLGIQTEVMVPERRENSGTDNEVVSPRLKITIKNVSDAPLALIDSPDHCGFVLESEGWTSTVIEVADNRCKNYTTQTADLIILNPEQSQDFEFDLSQPRWHLLVDGEIKEIGTFGFSEQFRLVYQSPSRTDIDALNNNTEVWSGELPSRAFYASGRID
jgi:uncharacterized membrane-anchored protein